MPPLLDVSDVLLDSEFFDFGLVCFRNVQSVDATGIASNTTTATPFGGVVTNNAGDLLVRLSEGARIKGSITVHTKFRLTDGADGVGADEITWQGNRYTVSTVGNWSTYGAGFMAVNCDLIPLSGGTIAG